MKRIVFVITLILATLFFLPKASGISAASCIPSGSCKLPTQECCNGKKPVFAKDCTFKMQCSDTGEAIDSTAENIKPLSEDCNYITDANTQTLCNNCMLDTNKIWTALGCIDPSATGLISKFLPFGIGIAGGVAFLIILFGALQMMMSSGNPEKLNAGKELITAAITGLLLIIFSVFILQLVGVQILKIPGFG